MTKYPSMPPDRSMPAHRVQAIREIVVSNVAGTTARVPRKRFVAVLAAGLTFVLATGAGAYVLLAPEETFTSIACHSAPRLDADAAVTETTSGEASDPVEVCKALWEEGRIGDSPAPPSMIACVSDSSGAISVFPDGTGGCRNLGLAPLNEVDTAGAKSVVELREALKAKLPVEGCVDIDSAARVARQELAARGFENWSVRLRLPHDGCASFGLEVTKKEVYLVGTGPK